MSQLYQTKVAICKSGIDIAEPGNGFVKSRITFRKPGNSFTES
jgi:hypothetical protein